MYIQVSDILYHIVLVLFTDIQYGISILHSYIPSIPIKVAGYIET